MSAAFRRMTGADVEAVYVIEKASFASPWTKNSFIEEIETNEKARYFVVEDGGEIVAYGGLWCILDELHITNIAVKPSARRRGFGAVLVEGMVAFARDEKYAHMTLEVRVGNSAAIALYEKYGFKSVGVRPKYYIDSGEDALVMWKEL